MGHPLSGLFVRCTCHGWKICTFCSQLMMAGVAIVIGILIFWKPKKAIDLQAAIYRPFNWSVKPIVMKKEITSVRLMGLTLIISGTILLILVLSIR